MEAHKGAITVIDHAGDTVINCCNEAGDTLENFLVSSKVISLSSPVLRVMLDPSKPYARSKSLSSEKIEIKSTLGQPRFMKTILHALHYQNRQVPMEFPLQDLASLAEICDFYDLSEALKPWTLQWTLKLWASDGKSLDLGLWCRMAIAFSDMNILDEVMVQLIKKSKKDKEGVIVPLGESCFPCSLPKGLPNTIWRKRENLLKFLIQKLDYECKKYKSIGFTDSLVCKEDQAHGTARRCDSAQLAAICKIGIALGYPVLDWSAISLEEVLTVFRSAKDDGLDIGYHKSDVYRNSGDHSVCSVTGRIRAAADRVSRALEDITYYDLINGGSEVIFS
ncbi:hypothetical protein TWF718_009644 [Orbilia javanica]|uniref:Uncharacterized protein n=1 Tax=Orbilia javanica TaxID=47235 RepID=A0AAN8MJ87_9PEZI